LRHINISLLWVQEQEKLKKLVYEKVPGQDNPADLFTKGVGREKLQQFAWASGQIFLDGRAEAGLQVQGVGLSAVGIGSVPRGSLCVSSGSGNSVNPAGKQRAPNAADPKEAQHKSKNSELARVKLVGGQLKCIIAKHIPHYTRPIGGASTSDAKPDWWCHPRRKCRGGVGDNLHTLAHAQFGRWACENHNVYTYNRPYVSADAIGFSYWNKLKGYMHTSAHAPIGSWGAAHLSVHAQSESCRNIGVRRMYTDTDAGVQHDQQERWGQCSLRYPPTAERPLKPWRQIQGGVVEPEALFGGHGPWRSGIADVTGCVSCDSYSVSYQKVFICMYCK